VKQKEDRFSAKEILTLIVGTTLAFTFVIIVAGVMYALVFVTQPVAYQSPNDAAFIEKVLVPIVLFLSGALSGVLAANGLGNNKRTSSNPTNGGNP
jgi:peptidoglycan biosynthesis protein MviN/MurJ (putative lipid II flippase)